MAEGEFHHSHAAGTEVEKIQNFRHTV